MPSKIPTRIIILLFLLIMSIKVNIQPVELEPETIIVPNDYPKIQEAIDAANVGDHIYVYSGTYTESLVVDKSLVIVGERTESTIIDGNGTGTVIKVIAEGVVITGFTIRNSGSSLAPLNAGIWLSANANITRNLIAGNAIGIYVNSIGSNIVKNNVTNNRHGISLYFSSEVTVEANNVTSNEIGISLAGSSNNIISNNNIAAHTDGHGITLSSNSHNNTLVGNNLIGNAHGMSISDSSDNLITRNIIAKNTILGIELAGSTNNTLYHNDFVNNQKHVVVNQPNTWDNGYPSGGNYWHNYKSVDYKSGPNQDQPNSDGIWDDPYIINENNLDRYPSVDPYGDISNLFDGTKPVDKTEPIPPLAIAITGVSAGIILTAVLIWKLKVSKKTKRKRIRRYIRHD